MAPKTEAYADLDELMEDSHLYDLCFKSLDSLLYVTPAGMSSVGNVYREDCHLIQELKDKAMLNARFNSEFQKEQAVLVPWIQVNIDPAIGTDFVSLAKTCEHIRAAVHHRGYGNSSWVEDIPEPVL